MNMSLCYLFFGLQERQTNSKKYEKHCVLELKSDFTDEEISQIEEMSNSYKMNVNTTHQFMYMEGFCCHFNIDALVFRTVARNDDKVFQFFTSEDFQRWSLARYFDGKADYYKSDLDYKPELKLITSDVTRDTSYLKQTKVYSRRHGVFPLKEYIPISPIVPV